MIERIDELHSEVETFAALSAEELEAFRIKMLGKKGVVTKLFNEFRNVPADQKKEFGRKLNELKELTQNRITELRTALEDTGKPAAETDLTLPADSLYLGSRHPVALVRNEIIEIFTRLGFTLSEGPEIEDDRHVFSALNFPEEHPARDMQDTFFVTKSPDILLRTHTSSVQVRVMENEQPPIRTISPGRVFRNEAISARSHCIFHQVEGLYVDEGVSFADLKQMLVYFAKELFGRDTEIRLRPSFFPFTEPSGEMDISCSICKGKGCNVCKYTGWLEILGCGMVDPNVLDNCGIDSKKYTG
ncbi:MAG: phenylalanine--tRNA ligase subunit alpha, partial [Bacteroidetes bacterium]|nr:phenylalanine--tRNA ligase subunit alpha [Bacteroidota bacterium]